MKRLASAGAAVLMSAVAGVYIAGTGSTAVGGPPQPSASEIALALGDYQEGTRPSPGSASGVSALAIRPSDSNVVFSEPLGTDRVVVTHGVNARNQQRTMFALLAHEDGIGWYVARAWDRPDTGLTWAEFQTATDHVFVWDGLPLGKRVSLRDDSVDSANARGMLPISHAVSDAAVQVR